MKKQLIIGITGGIGSGKSVISNILMTMGIPVYNSDREAKRLMHESQWVKERLIKQFGNALYREERLDKTLLASLIFQNKDCLQQVNSIVHPAVTADFLSWTHIQKGTLLAVESALLFESDLINHVTHSIHVTAPLELRIQRVMQRDHAKREAVLERIHNQMSDDERSALATYTIDNDEISALLPQLKQIIQTIERNAFK